MAITRLKEPIPIPGRSPAPPREVAISGLLPLPAFSGRPIPPLDRVLSKRQSRRAFRSISRGDLADFLALTLRPNATTIRPGRSAQHPLPSFGGLRAVRCLFFNAPGISNAACVYEPRAHALGLIPMEPQPLKEVFATFEELVPLRNAVLILFVTDVRRATSAYRHVESLIWRDVGVLLGGMSLVAEGLGLSFCPLGRIGGDESAHLLPTKHWAAAGSAVLGARTRTLR